jgi:tetratricopeptide (TPR) repeat protein
MRRLLVVSVGLTALMVGVVVAWYAVRQEREFQRLIGAGDAALAQDQTSSAIEAFSGALALKRDSMLAHLKRGDTYRRRGELNAALRDLREAAALDPSAPRPVELLGDVNVATGNYRQAIAHYVSFTQLDDRSPRVLYKLGLAYFRNDQTSEALQPLQHAISLDNRFAEAHYLLAMCQRARSDNDAALKSLTRAIEIDGAFVEAREELADLYEQLGRRQQALEQLEALAALEPGRRERLIRAGLTYARWGRSETAILTLGRAAERFPDRDDVHIALGRVWLGIAESRDDQAALKKAIAALQPRTARADASPEALMLYGRAMFLSGDATRAERALLQATSKAPVDPLAYRYLADAAERLGHVAAAVDALVRYAALIDDRDIDPSINERLARLEQRLGRG